MARGFSRKELAVLMGGFVGMVLGVGVVIYETEPFCEYRGPPRELLVERRMAELEARARGYLPPRAIYGYPLNNMPRCAHEDSQAE